MKPAFHAQAAHLERWVQSLTGAGSRHFFVATGSGL
jgi:hypothetical protein